MPDSRPASLALLGGEPAVRIPSPHFRWPLIGAEEEEAVLNQLRSGQLSIPRRCGVIEEFEANFAAFHGLPYSLSTGSGTAALHAAYFGLGLEPGDEVLAPAYTHLGTVLPMLQLGLIPVLCDVEEETGNLDPSEIENRLSPRTRALAITHQYGHISDMEAIIAAAKRHNLSILEDCSHAHGATDYGKLAGTFGDVACFSLQAHKVISAGEGGILVTKDPRIFERAALLGHFRERRSTTTDADLPFVETGYGLKNRFHPLAAALAVVQLRKLPETIEKRRRNMQYFEAALEETPGVRPLPTRPGVSRGGYFRFLVRYNPDELYGLPIEQYIRAVRAEGVLEISPGSLAKPLHLTRIFQTLTDGMYSSGWPRKGPHVSRELVYRPGDFPRAERFSALTIQFPAFTEPSVPIIDAYCSAMKKVASHVLEILDACFPTTL
jgi:perosamine synthetase